MYFAIDILEMDVFGMELYRPLCIDVHNSDQKLKDRNLKFAANMHSNHSERSAMLAIIAVDKNRMKYYVNATKQVETYI